MSANVDKLVLFFKYRKNHLRAQLKQESAVTDIRFSLYPIQHGQKLTLSIKYAQNIAALRGFN